MAGDHHLHCADEHRVNGAGLERSGSLADGHQIAPIHHIPVSIAAAEVR